MEDFARVATNDKKVGNCVRQTCVVGAKMSEEDGITASCRYHDIVFATSLISRDVTFLTKELVSICVR